MADRIPIRNVIILGHSHSGKTQLSEALLQAGGAVPKAGSVDSGTTVSDYNDDEKERKISINSSVLHFTKDGVKVNLIDTPGYSDFAGEAYTASKAVDAAIVVVNAVTGVEIGTDKALKLIEENNLPAIIFVNKLDKEHADFSKTSSQLTERLGKKCAPFTSPIGQATSFKGIVNLITKEKLGELQGDDKSNAEKLAESLIENVAESDDALLEKYLDKGELSEEEFTPALKKAVLEGKVMPLLVGSAVKAEGIKELIDCIINDLPSPGTRELTETTFDPGCPRSVFRSDRNPLKDSAIPERGCCITGNKALYL